MRILQIIDSLEPGGAEKMAVNYANALVDKIEFSGLVSSRKEGLLREQLRADVGYLFLEKKKCFDFKALFKLKNFVKKHKIDIVHAHSTSFFLAFMLKCVCLNVQLVWHDHYGDSEFLEKRPRIVLKFILPFFKGSIAVNKQLKEWLETILKLENVIYLPNFITKKSNEIAQTQLKGEEGKRIICVANLRLQKNHFMLLEVAKIVQQHRPDWSFHIVGKNNNDVYANSILEKIQEKKLEQHVFLYGLRIDIGSIIKKAEIGILTSLSEGLPVALLEYGLYAKPVVVTAVGQIPDIVISHYNGLVLGKDDINGFAEAILDLINNKQKREMLGKQLAQNIKESFVEEAVIDDYLDWLK